MVRFSSLRPFAAHGEATLPLTAVTVFLDGPVVVSQICYELFARVARL
jgi:hypothetical protein